MHFDYAPFPLLSYPSHYEADSLTEPRFEREAFPCKVNDLCEAIAKGQVDKLKSYISSTENKADILDQNGESALHHAARINRVEVIDFLIKAGASVDIYSKDGFTPLHEAARSNSLEAFDNLLKKGANPNGRSTTKGYSPLHIATQYGNKEIIQRLLNVKTLKINATNRNGLTALHLAISRGYEEICSDLIAKGCSINIITRDGQTCLHLAADVGIEGIVSEVIQTALRSIWKYPVSAMSASKDIPEFDQFINRKNKDQNSALHLAVQTGRLSVCQILVQHGANVNRQNKHQQTPLHVASMGKNKDILELLIKCGARTDQKDSKQRTPLHSAASFGNPESIKVLLSNCATPDPRDTDGMTPLLCAIAAGHTKCAKLLLEYGANIRARERNQRGGIHLAVEYDREEMLKMLLERSGSQCINIPDIQGKTAVHYATSSTNLKLLEILLEKKANCLLEDRAGITPLHTAAEFGKDRHVEALAKTSLACVDQRDSYGRTPLHFAALNGKGKICSILLQMGAEVNISDAYGCTPLMFAAKTGASGLIRMFLELNADINQEDKNGNTALLFASASGHVDAVRILLNSRAILKPNISGLNCFDLAIENQQGDVVMAMIKNARWREVLSANILDGQNRMGKLIQQFPDAAKSVMDRCVQRSLSPRSIKYDFSFLDPGPDDTSGPDGEPFFGLKVMVEHKEKELLVHELCRKLLKIKWHRYGWFVYWTNLILFSLYLFSMTYFMVTKRKAVILKRKHDKDDPDDADIFKNKEALNKAFPFLILAFASIHLSKKFYQAVLQRVEYFLQLTNLMEWVLYTASIVFILPYVSSSFSSLQRNPRIAWQIGTVAVFLGYMNLILFIQTLDYVGIYVTMFFRVAITVLKAISLFFLFALAFSVVFYILFKEQKAFDTFFFTLVKVIVMTLGELDYTAFLVDNLEATNPETKAPLMPYRESSFVFLCLFIFAMPIILMNLLVGLAVGDIESVQKYAFLRNKGKFIDFVVGVERNLPKFVTRRLHKPELVVTGRYVDRKISSGKYSFEDEDLGNVEQTTEIEDGQRLEALAKELARAKRRQLSIIDAMQDQRRLLLALATKIGLNTCEEA